MSAIASHHQRLAGIGDYLHQLDLEIPPHHLQLPWDAEPGEGL